MKKRGMSKLGIFFLIFIIILFILGLLFYIFFIRTTGNPYEGGTVLVNPTYNLTLEEAVQKFDKSFVVYLLYSIKAYNLHNPPFSSNKPKIEIIVQDKIFSAVIDKGSILVSEGGISEKDIIIRTTKEEGVKMIRDSSYIQESFKSGSSSIELISGKTTLAAKGYLNLYTEITGKGITGDFLKGF